MKRFVVVAVMMALLTSAADARHKRPMTDHKRIRILQELVYQLRMQAKAAANAPAFLKHAWPSLTPEEQSAITEVAKTLPKGVKFDIVCNDASCSELASDIDDALEAAGIESGLDHAAGPLGYGLGLTVNEFDRPHAEKAVEMLKKATGGRLAPSIVNGSSPPGYVSIIIGKRPR
jgi:hypothetical protein